MRGDNCSYNLPLFVVFEGIDGSGKSTLCNMTYEYYNAMSVPVVKLAEPTNGIWGNKIRKLLSGSTMPDAHEQLKLFLLDREEDVRRNILPALTNCKLIIMDRYYYSNIAYQGVSDISPESILTQNIEMGFPKPNRVYLIDIDPEESLKRIVKRNIYNSHDIFERKPFLEKVRKLYLSFTDDSFFIIDGRKTVEESFQCIINDINKSIKLLILG
ncbi:MAG: dTMP kinase [Spirochaetota bacterium]|nr:dTMP kinase [Spirochaetota bacterium]